MIVGMRWRYGLAALACLAVLGDSVGAGAARTAFRAPTIIARRIAKQPGALAPGTLVGPAALATPRVFVDGEHGYALAIIQAITYPARTVDGGHTWRIDGPALHKPAAQGPMAVGEIGVANANTAFAWGGVAPNTVVDVTTDGGKHWRQAFLPGSVLFVGIGAPGELLANVHGFVPQGHTVHTGLWAYATKSGRVWSYSNSLT
jgi:hypothetical protein